jgi:hypothetical protein
MYHQQAHARQQNNRTCNIPDTSNIICAALLCFAAASSDIGMRATSCALQG